ncbi:MFS transporter [Nocardioides sp. zg-536]|uniref:MFS transporter n=1 Tax=Nocardioides faecalis TaxID=2803858 RepID=A0A938Y7P9_9ACTN|nr:MFS transporter [Nocardioides faecalis]MBM9459021.1 MFS transporter [Nocardioides faecalis]QVI57288.1 MFS transporter [Nocardioides faecalis]
MSVIDGPGRLTGGPREWTGLVVLVLVVLLLAIDGTVLYLAVPSLTEDLAPSANQVLWIGDIYAFVLAGLLITMGNVADRIGRKRLLLIGTACFGVASVLAAFAPSAEALIAARALLGVAGSTLMPSTLSMVRAMFPEARQRAKAIALWTAGATAGAALGPLVGGALLEHFWWGSVFLINVPVMVVAFAAGWFLLDESKGETAGRIDLLSSVMSVGTIVPVVFAVKRFVTDGLEVPAVAALVVGAVVGWLFARRQRGLDVPLLDVSLFKVPAFAGALAANVLAIFGFLGLLFFLSQYLQMVRGYGPLKAGWAEMPGTLASMVVVALVGVALARLGAGRSIGAGLFVASLGLAVTGLATGWSGYWGIGAGLALLGLGAGLAMALSVNAVVGAVPPQRAGAASAVAETGYELGGAFGIAILGSLQTLFYRSSLELPADSSALDRAAAEESLASAVYGSEDPGVISAAQDAFAAAMQSTSFLAAAILLVAAVVAWRLIPSERQPGGAVLVEH